MILILQCPACHLAGTREKGGGEASRNDGGGGKGRGAREGQRKALRPRGWVGGPTNRSRNNHTSRRKESDARIAAAGEAGARPSALRSTAAEARDRVTEPSDRVSEWSSGGGGE